MGIKRLGYVIIQTAKCAEWDRLLTEVVGAMRGETAGTTTLYRLDDRSFRLWIEAGAEDRLVAAAYEVEGASELAALREKVALTGRPVEDGTAAEADARGVDAFFRTQDPSGNGLEFYHGEPAAGTPFVSPAGVEAFVTGDMGLGHVVFAAPAFQQTHAFYKDIGFRDTDVARFRFGVDPEDPGMGFAFMHAENGRHHSVAIGEMPQPPSGCVHIMLEMATQSDVGRCHDRMRKANIPESATIGRHVNDQTFGFYLQTPSGFDIEIGCDPLVIDPATWIPTSHTAPSEWGHVWAWQEALEKQRG